MLQNKTAMKACPYCAESIQDAAIICRFCQRELPAAPVTVAPPAPSSASSEHIVTAIVILGLVTIAALGLASVFSSSAPSTPRPTATPRPTRVEPPPPLEFFVRPQSDGVRFRNDGKTRWRVCRAEIDGHLAEFYEVQPGNGRTVTYREFKGLPADEGFTRARRRLELTCILNNQAQSAIYRVE